MKKILNYFLVLFWGILIISCESKNDNITVDFGSSSNLKPSSIEIPIHAQTHIIDSVRSDEANLLIPIGTSSSTAFGTTRSSFASQVYYSGSLGKRLGDNAKLKAVHLKIPVSLKSLSRKDYNTLLNDKRKTKLVKGNNRNDVDTLVTQYTVDSIFNKRSNDLALSIYKLRNKLDAFSADYYSDGIAYGKNATGNEFTTGQKLGGGTVSTTVQDTIYAFYNSETKKYSFSRSVQKLNYIIELPKDNFETLFEEVQDGTITNETIFKEKFPGMVIEPDSNKDGFTFLTSPSGVSIQMDYTYISTSTSDGKTTSKTKNSVALTIRENSECRVSKYERTRSQDFRDAEDKNEFLYLQGQGGSELLLTIDKKKLEEFKKKYVTANGQVTASIIDAYFDLYVDESKTNSSIPFWLYLYDNENSREIGDFRLFNRGATIDTYRKRIGGIYDKKQQKYRFEVTKHIKDIVENKKYIDPKDTREDEKIEIKNVQLAIRIGQHVPNSFIDKNLSDASIVSTDNRYHPGEFVAYGEATDSNKKLKLVILYTKSSKNN